MLHKKNIAIIPARGGSKRIPKKNIKKFLGKPIIAYSIQSAIKSNIFDDVIVSTDDDEIAKIAIKYGAKVPFIRSQKNSNDYATISDVLTEVVNNYTSLNINIENICCILPTAPFVTVERLLEAQTLFETNKYLSVFPVLEFSYPVKRSLVKNEDGSVRMEWPEHKNTRSQDLIPHYHDSGQFYFIKKDALLNEKTMFTSKSGVIQLSHLEVQDIDTIDDWKNAEIKYKIIKGLD